MSEEGPSILRPFGASASPLLTPLMPQADLDAAIGHYPAWAKALARKYFTKTLNQFILHGNVRDLVPTRDPEGATDYVPLRRFLADDLFAGRDVVLFYDRSDGIHFVDPASRADFARALSGYDTLFGTDYQKKLPKDPVRVFALLDNYVRLRLADGKRVAVVVDYAETIVPIEASATRQKRRVSDVRGVVNRHAAVAKIATPANASW